VDAGVLETTDVVDQPVADGGLDFRDQGDGRAFFQEPPGQYFVTETASFKLYQIYQYLTTVRAYIVSGELDKKA